MANSQRGVKRLVISFGPFRLLTAERRLELHSMPVTIGARALNILIALALRAGEVMPNNELIHEVWHGQIVDDRVLRVHVAALPKRLADGAGGTQYVVNVSGRGYCFISPVVLFQPSEPVKELAETPAHDRQPSSSMPPRQSLPPLIPGMVGRDDAVHLLVVELRRRRFVTILGAGGIGKTTVAIALGLLSWLESFYIWSGDWDQAKSMTKELMNTSQTYSLKPFFAIGSGFVGEILVKRGDVERGIPQLRRSIRLLQDSGDKTLIPVFACTLAEALLKTAELNESTVMIDFALNAEKPSGETFYTPELLRIKGTILSFLATDNPRAADNFS
jgi:DNA-binding winged helix-turn-helix (wHTH) protein